MRHAVPKSLLFALLLGAAGFVARALPDREARLQPVRAEHEEGRFKRARALESLLARASTGRGPLSPEGLERGYDVLTYDLAFDLNPAVVALEGRATIRLSSLRRGLSEIRLDLDDAMTVRSVERDGIPVTSFSAAADVLRIPLDPTLGAEERTTLVVRWGGTPLSGGALSFWTAPASGPSVSSLAEPFDARTFWPCVDDPADKAVTTVAVTVTIAAEYRSLDGTRTMPVVGYILPEHAAINRTRVASMVRHIEVLASLFGEYPYLDTKYGIVEGSFSGGMEHPTMTLIGASLLGNASRDLTSLLVHELAHMWWGDEVTMRTWDDIWLNEGFATYAEVLYYERTSGAAPGRTLTTRYDDGLYAGQLGPPVAAPANDPFRNIGAIYDKGGWVLHMLRKVVGDETFFAGLREYRRRHARGNATRADLRAVFEELSGRDLKQFFDQWVETPYRPVLRASWRNVAGGKVEVTVRQNQGHAVVHAGPAPGDTPHYRFPLVLRVFSAASAATTAVVDVTKVEETFTLASPGGAPAVSLVLDPDGDLLKIVEAVGPGA